VCVTVSACLSVTTVTANILGLYVENKGESRFNGMQNRTVNEWWNHNDGSINDPVPFLRIDSILDSRVQVVPMGS
jgi:hypothetical protein